MGGLPRLARIVLREALDWDTSLAPRWCQLYCPEQEVHPLCSSFLIRDVGMVTALTFQTCWRGRNAVLRVQEVS